MAVTQVSLDEPLEAFVQEQVRQGRYASPKDGIAAGIELLRERERELGALRAELDAGAAGGEGRSLDEACDRLADKYRRLPDRAMQP